MQNILRMWIGPNRAKRASRTASADRIDSIKNTSCGLPSCRANILKVDCAKEDHLFIFIFLFIIEPIVKKEVSWTQNLYLNLKLSTNSILYQDYNLST